MVGIIQALVLVLLTAVSFALAAVEAAFYLLRRRRLGHFAVQNPRAELVNRYLEDPPALLMPVHIGTYTAHVGMTIVITALFIDHLATWALALAFGVMVLYLLLFRLTLPYALVRSNPERSLLLLLPIFHPYAQAMAPGVRFLRKRAAFERVPEEGEETKPSAPEVPPPPVRESDEMRLGDALARFSETQVREVMTPRPDVVAIASTADIGDLKRLMRETKYSRIPVFGENLDDIIGVAEVRDVLDHEGGESEPLKLLARPVFLVPETKRIAELLRELQAQRTTFAVVIDEYGGTAGLVSVEDIVEELVGEIKDEYDVEAEPISVEKDGALLVAGRVTLDRLEQALEKPLRDGGEVDTVGGLVTAVFGRIPRAGETIDYRGFSVEVVNAERKRVNRVRFRRKPEEASA